MSTPSPSVRRAGRALLVVGLVVATYGTGVITGIARSHAGSQAAPAAVSGLLDEAAARIMADAAQPVSLDQLDQAAVEGMLKALGDRWSVYYSPSDFASFQSGLDGHYSGIGVWLRAAQNGDVIIGSVQPGSPASGAGIAAGDQLVSVSGISMVSASLSAVADELRGEAGTAVRIGLMRDGRQLTRVVTRSDFASDDVIVTRLKGGVEVVRVGAFTRGVGAAVRKALLAAPSADPAGLSATVGVVLDLRGNPGGLLTEAVEVASAFLSGGTVVSYERRGLPVQQLDAIGEGNVSVPLVVLVDEGTASAAEVVAGALQDRNRAVIVGSHTFGKGSIQEPRALSDGSAIEFTVGRYFTPSGRSLDGLGIEPDVLVAGRAGSATAEQRALEVLRGLVAASDASQRG